jgi:hypothetical protein
MYVHATTTSSCKGGVCTTYKQVQSDTPNIRSVWLWATHKMGFGVPTSNVMHFVCVCVCVFWSINSSLASFGSSSLSFDELVQMVPSFLHVVPQSTFFFTNFKGGRAVVEELG